MGAHDIALFEDAATAARLAVKFGALDTQRFLRLAIEDLFAGKIALVSSFGADSAVLLHMVAEIDRNLPVIFIDTLQLFPETIAYRDRLVDLLGLTDLRTIQPDPQALAKHDPENFLWASDPDLCCELRKVDPLVAAVDGFEAWITGRKRFQSDTRRTLPLFETEGERVKVNPLAGWSTAELAAYFEKYELPQHELVAKNYLSIGCMACTSPVKPGEDPRAGRWRGRSKTECGIHLFTSGSGI